MTPRLVGPVIEADTVSSAWLRTVRTVSQVDGRRAYHLVTRIADPIAEDLALRARVDGLLAERGNQPVATVANTIFPEGMARRTPEPTDLGDRYREAYERLRRFPKNRDGTYFGRIVDLPRSEGKSLNQLAEVVRKLRVELDKTSNGPMSARYEVQVHVPGTDNSPMGFPCLSWCSFQLDGRHLHLVAHYRSQYLIERAYGNYLGLGRLQAYVARTVGLQTGELMVVAGYVQVDGRWRSVDRLLRATTEAR